MTTFKGNRLKDELSCSVCCETYADTKRKMPIMLLCCQKVFCQSCINSVQTCPNCRKVVTSAGQRPCRILLSILDCLCCVCHRHERDKSCVHCNASVCRGCFTEHLSVHDEDVAMKQAELVKVLQVAEDFIDRIKDGLEDLRTNLRRRQSVLSGSGVEEDSLKGATSKMREEELEEQCVQSVEKRYLEKVNSQRRMQAHVSNYIVPKIVTIARELHVPVPSSLSNFNRKPLFESLQVVSNVDLPIPADQFTFINALSINQVLSQIANQPCVDHRHLVNNSTPMFQLMQDESATLTIRYKNFVLVATTRARVLILRDECLEFALPSIAYGNSITGLTVTTVVDGTEMILAVDGSEKVYRHQLRSNEGPWDVFFAGDSDVGFVDVVTHEACIYLASREHIHILSSSQEIVLDTVRLEDEERNPCQIILVTNDIVLLKKYEQRYILVRSLVSEFETKKLEFNFVIRHIQYDKEKRLLSLIGYHEASDQFALHTYTA